MSKYKYIIRDYHAIKEAEIKLDGITVLSGINGCGKSTLSRWLYYLINGAKGFEAFLYKEYKDKISRFLYQIQYACKDLERFLHGNVSLDKKPFYKLLGAFSIIESADDKSEQLRTIVDLFQQTLCAIEDFLIRSFALDLPVARKARILKSLNISNFENNDFDQAIESFKEQNIRLINKLSNQLCNDIEERPIDKFFELVIKSFKIQNEPPSFIQLEEDDVNVIEKDHISTFFNLKTAVYIDTPMAIETGDTDNIFWVALRELMMNENKNKDFSVEEKKFKLRIKDLLDGEAILEKDEMFDTESLRYVSKDKKVNILLKDAATGFKTFSYLQRLLENGLLNNETLLMIDEPEAHLHPQWIVEFARLLVLLNKELGLKIMIASHNPDMVAAIHDIANKEGVLENTNFYVAQPENPESHQYIFKDLGHEVGEIFESFNIALDNINRYGRVDL